MIKMGEGTVGGLRNHVYFMFEGTPGEANITIGNYCSLGPDITLIPKGNHPLTNPSTYPFGTRMGVQKDYEVALGGDIVIGHDVWIGTRAVLLGPCNIGHGAIIGANTVITKDIPPYAVVVGSPPRILKYRFEPDVVEALLEIQWWNWPPAIVQMRWEELQGDINEFVRRYRGY